MEDRLELPRGSDFREINKLAFLERAEFIQNQSSAPRLPLSKADWGERRVLVKMLVLSG